MACQCLFPVWFTGFLYLDAQMLHKLSRLHCADCPIQWWWTAPVEDSGKWRSATIAACWAGRWGPPLRGWRQRCRPRRRGQMVQTERRYWSSPQASAAGCPHCNLGNACWSPPRSPAPVWWWWPTPPGQLSTDAATSTNQETELIFGNKWETTLHRYENLTHLLLVFREWIIYEQIFATLFVMSSLSAQRTVNDMSEHLHLD